MSKERTANLFASVRQRLLDRSREKGEDFQLVLTRFAVERFLYRLASSRYSGQFVLKGAMLVNIWMGGSHRPTRDLDLLGYGDESGEHLSSLFREICEVEVEPDGLVFDGSSIQVAEIREDQEYQGQRVKLVARLGRAVCTVQVDIGFGDAVVPEAQMIEFPTVLDFPTPIIRAYAPETVVSEKLQAMVALGMVNSRMKDFYDLGVIARQFTFEGSKLVNAIRATFERRRTAIPDSTPPALSEAFASDRDKRAQWKAFLNRAGLEDTKFDLPDVVRELRVFLLPPLRAAAADTLFNEIWRPGGPWLTIT
jgi:hypothetical protein